MIEHTLVLIKPDGVERGLIGRIIERFENVGLKIAGMKMVWLDKKFAKEHYAAHVDKPFYKGLETFIISGPVVALALGGIDAVEIVRKMVGETEPKSSAPGTIRGDFSHHSYGYADKKGIAIKNLIHASGSKQDAKSEIELWFEKNELHTYKTVHEKHTL
ncbi:nucleoside-diphosphate kinase [Candidatus Woesearchaeota archaeon CG10_big_fil_rev_8_21_14_0_10_34_8]|nr:MAG: nucleoside-diphosphate kinase [Candidatus Woesearchaeota archaeon CG10_big_fil_rev_8_21_14_0_10_34_8]